MKGLSNNATNKNPPTMPIIINVSNNFPFNSFAVIIAIKNNSTPKIPILERLPVSKILMITSINVIGLLLSLIHI